MSGALPDWFTRGIGHIWLPYTQMKTAAGPLPVARTQGSRIFVNVPEARQIAVIDRKRGKVEATWPVAEAQANFPMALDEAVDRVRQQLGRRVRRREISAPRRAGVKTADAGKGASVDAVTIEQRTAAVRHRRARSRQRGQHDKRGGRNFQDGAQCQPMLAAAAARSIVLRR